MAGHGLQTLEAALTAGEDPLEGVPAGSALFLPPTAGEELYGRTVTYSARRIAMGATGPEVSAASLRYPLVASRKSRSSGLFSLVVRRSPGHLGTRRVCGALRLAVRPGQAPGKGANAR
jgi:hypothetical protein